MGQDSFYNLGCVYRPSHKNLLGVSLVMFLTLENMEIANAEKKFVQKCDIQDGGHGGVEIVY